MGKTNNHDIQIGHRNNPVARFSFWLGLISLPASVFWLGLPLGIIAFVMGGKVVRLAKSNPELVDSKHWGQAKMGRFFGVLGVVISTIWGIIVLLMAIIGGIASLFK